MHDLRKTVVFALVACLCVAAAVAAGWLNQPPVVSDDDTGQTFYPGFDDPFRVAALEIVRFDLEANLPVVFRVSRNDQGDWVIPTKDNYPVLDASPLAAVANALIGRRKLSYVRGDDAAEHATYGVLDPETARPGPQDQDPEQSIGAKVTLYDAGGHVLAAFVIGKEVPDQPEIGSPDVLRYVRDPLTDRVYTTRLDDSALTTRFGDWVDPSLVRLQPRDVRRIVVDDHSVDIRPNETLEFKLPDRTEQRPLYQLKPGKTFEVRHDSRLAGAAAFDVPGAVQALSAEQAARLGEVLGALSDLKFIDVAPIRAKVGSALIRREPLALDQEGTLDLIDHGYFTVSQAEPYAKEGVMRIELTGGVEVVLRFGNAALVDRRNLGGEDGGGGRADATETGRYLLFSARFDRSAIPEPKLKPEPDPGKRLANNASPKETMDQFTAIQREGLLNTAEQRTLRDRIQQENQAQRAAYEKRVRDAQSFVDQVNNRCQGWYYVISDEDFEKLRLQRSDLPLPAEMAKK